ncbi:formate C-acetyltransferase/glycerol dehydratase family glycyl radical enzyme [Clostridium fermenticellae]|uniref:Formate C-acetyltransferase/glycerol dehydratase family glycyl radical enzyme n=1 Tax=Clostridium fermenticellae TaxID=2068654 RepID=A0A386H488_9CLOT|nr:formate C-acetyltransferase/glycerol dehydratase family glycyl radical enzyme [Clostridium fermenticellae]AYD40539.1 formate C-acetyltransferase/glycerol dehydratase family glycyl radical enzyme [Clostridium fermenticellae]
MLTERIKMLKEKQNKVKPSIGVERARLATEAIEKHAVEPPVLQKAYMLAHILKNMTIFIQDGELIVGNLADKPRCAPVFPEYNSEWIVEEIDEFATRPTDPLLITDEEKKELVQILSKWKGNSFEKIVERNLSEKSKNAEKSGVMTIGNRDCGTGHLLPDYYNLLRNGLNYYKEKCQQKIAETVIDCREKAEQVDFWNAVIIAIDGVGELARRYSELAAKLAEKEKDPVRKDELLEISSNCKNIPLKPAKTFMEAVQFVWFIHVIINIETNGHGISFHRFDQYINDFYVNDLSKGSITEEKAIEILQCFFIKVTDIIKLRDKFYSESFAGYPMWQNLIIGGQTSDGKDASNETSYLVLKANKGVQTSQPTASLRYFNGTPEKLVEEALKMIQEGMATPAFFNDNLVIPIIMDKFGVSIEEARNWGIQGCVQPCVAGYSDGRPTVGYVNLLKCLELALHNGINPVNGEQLGPKTGELESIDSLEKLKKAFYTQIDYFVDLMLTGFNVVGAMHALREPAPFASMTINDCIEKGKSVQSGGARYSESGAFICGIGNTTDAIAAIDTLVFKKKTLSMDQLMDALNINFKGKEDIRLTLLNKAPKYGNDNDYVDSIAADIVKHYRKSISRYHDSRGGKYVVVIESQSLNVSQGKSVLASADGRFAHDAVNDNCSPVMGRDINGPTAAVKSVAKLDQKNAQDGCLYNIRFEPRSIQGEKGRQVLESVIKTYFDNMGEHIQINVIDNETLKAAQKEPEKYRNLLVRVAGYLAYFTELDKHVQDNIISRTAHVPS